MVTGIGMANTKHTATVLTGHRSDTETTTGDCVHRVDTGVEPCAVTEAADGEASVLSYTIEYARDGSVSNVLYVLELADGSHSVANAGDPESAAAILLTQDPVGLKGHVRHQDHQNFFEPGASA